MADTHRHKETHEVAPAWKWKLKNQNVNVQNLNPAIIDYLNTLEPEFQDMILATSGNDGDHVSGSTHFGDTGIDLRIHDKETPYNDMLFKRLASDPSRVKAGIALLDPVHGTAAHIHLSVNSEKELKNDVFFKFVNDQYSTSVSEKDIDESVKQFTQQGGLEDNPFLRDAQMFSQTSPASDADAKEKAEQAKLAKVQALKDNVLRKQSERRFLADIASSADLEVVTNERAISSFEDGGVIGDDHVANNLFNRTFRPNKVLENKVLEQFPVLKNVGSARDFKILEAEGKTKTHLQQTNRNPEYFGVGDTWFPFLDDVNQPIDLPNANKQRTLIDDDDLDSQQVIELAGLDFVSHGLSEDAQYMHFKKLIGTELIESYGEDFINSNGGVDAYMRGLISDSPEYDIYKKEAAEISPELVSNLRYYVRNGKVTP